MTSSDGQKFFASFFQERRFFFFEKKKQKTFTPGGNARAVGWASAHHSHPKPRAPLILLALLASTSLSRAQTPPIPDGKLERIIVTAKKRRQDIQTVPQTVDAVGGANLQRLAIQQFQDVAVLVAGLALSDNGGQGQNISIRGITYDPDTAANPAVDLYINEVPISQTSTAFQDLYDIDQVEVIRGPQGTLRGRTSPAGAILIDTKKPDLTKTTGYILQTFSDDGQFHTELAASVPVVQDKVAVRVAGLFDQNNLYGTRDVTTGTHDFNLQHSFRVTLELKPIDDLDIVIMQQDSNDRTRQLFGVTGDGNQGIISPAQNLAVEPGDYTFYDRTELTTIEATYRFDGSELTYNGGYQAIKDEFYEEQDKGDLVPYFPSGGQQLNEGLEQLTQELRFQSSGDQRFNYMAGGYYAHQDANATVFTPSEYLFVTDPSSPFGAKPAAIVNANVHIPQLFTDYAGFTDESYKITDDDVIEGGLRYQFEQQYRANGYIAYLDGTVVSQNQLIHPNNQSESYHAWTGLASYSHKFTPDLLLYATYGESYRPGGSVIGESLPLPESFLLFRPETSYDFEIGTKTQLFGGRVRINADIYHQAYSNYIGREPELWTTEGFATATTNGNALARGAEFNANAFVTDRWHLLLNVSYADAHYLSATLPCNDYNGSGAPNTNGPMRVIGGGLFSTCKTSGSLGEPNWAVSTQSEYDIPITDKIEGFLRGVYSFTPRSENQLTGYQQDIRNTVNLYLGAHSPGTGWEAFLFVKNVFNAAGYANIFGEQYNAGFLIDGACTATSSCPPQADYNSGYRNSQILHPREIGGTISYHF